MSNLRKELLEKIEIDEDESIINQIEVIHLLVSNFIDDMESRFNDIKSALEETPSDCNEAHEIATESAKEIY